MVEFSASVARVNDTAIVTVSGEVDMYTAPLDVGSAAANARASAHAYVRTLRRAFRRRPTFFAFYVGRGDRRFRAENVRLDRELRAARVPHLFRLDPGRHAQSVWSVHAVAWLRLALTHLEPAR